MMYVSGASRCTFRADIALELCGAVRPREMEAGVPVFGRHASPPNDLESMLVLGCSFSDTTFKPPSSRRASRYTRRRRIPLHTQLLPSLHAITIPAINITHQQQQQQQGILMADDLWPVYGSPPPRPPGAYPAFPKPAQQIPVVEVPVSPPRPAQPFPTSSSSSESTPTSASTLPTSPSTARRQSRQRSIERSTGPPKPWVHDPSRPCFLPPAGRGAPTPLSLLHDSLHVIREYREFVDTVGRLEEEYGRSLAAAVRKFETRLDATLAPPVGGKKPLPSTVAGAMRSHMYEIGALASLYQKRQSILSGQLALPLGRLERHGAESTRRLGGWAKDVRGRWDYGRERIESARVKYDESVRAHMTALSRLKACSPPGEDGSSSEWLRLEKVADEADRLRADRKHAYLVALAGEGREGGGGQTIAEGGGSSGWGEEARELYLHVQSTLTDLLRHHAAEDRAHARLVTGILERGERSYDSVDLVKDQDTFLAWNRRSITGLSSPGVSDEDEPQLSQARSDSTASSSEHTSMPSTPPASNGSLPCVDGQVGDPTLKCYEFIPPPFARDEKPSLAPEKRVDRNWLVNRWVISMRELGEVEDGEDGTLPKIRTFLAR